MLSFFVVVMMHETIHVSLKDALEGYFIEALLSQL